VRPSSAPHVYADFPAHAANAYPPAIFSVPICAWAGPRIRTAARCLPSNPPSFLFGLDKLQHQPSKARELRAFEAPERFYEVGSERGIADLVQKLSGS